MPPAPAPVTATPAAPTPVVASDDQNLPGFDPLTACTGALDAAAIPPVDAMGELPDRDGATVRFEALGGRFERTPTGDTLELAGEVLRECSPFAADGSLPTKPRVSATLSKLEPGAWSWPADRPDRWKKWSHLVSRAGQPWTRQGGDADKALLVVDEVDNAARRVKGRVLFCLDGGWLAGTFDVPVCGGE